MGQLSLAEMLAAFPALESGKVPEILIAPSNASARAKGRADYVCTGVDDQILIQSVIDGFPVLPQYVRSGVYVIGAKTGNIVLMAGIFRFSGPVVPPAGSVVVVRGEGVTSWRPIDPRPPQWEGGTMIYSASPTGKIWQYPQYIGNRVDTGVLNTIPTSGVWMRDIEMRIANTPATAGVAALNLDGMTTGEVRNVNVFCDLDITDNTTPKITQGLSLSAGARSDRKTLAQVAVFGYRDAGFVLNTTHIDANQLVSGFITGGSSSCAFQIAGDQNLRLFNLHAFSASIGVKLSGLSPIDIASIMFESVTTPVQMTTSRAPVHIGTAVFNDSTPWVGDMATDVVVDNMQWKGHPTTLTRRAGIATIPAGQTTVTVLHDLIGAPRTPPTTSTSIPVLVGVTYDATSITFTLAAAQAGPVVVGWDAKAA
jgi:hypothetical protein